MKNIVHNRILVYCCWFSVFDELPLDEFFQNSLKKIDGEMHGLDEYV